MLNIVNFKKKAFEIREPVIHENAPRLINLTQIDGKLRLKVILSGRGCSLPYCTMCPLPNYQSAQRRTIKNQLNHFFEYANQVKPDEIVIYNDGSFFSDKEVTNLERQYIAELFIKTTAKKLVVESLPQFLSESKLFEFKAFFRKEIDIQVSIGLQTQDDLYRKWLLGGSFNRNTFTKSIKLLQKLGYSTRAHILTPLPLLSLNESINELRKTANFLGKIGINKMSFCLLRSQKKTLVGRWYNNGIVQNPTPEIVMEAIHIGNHLKSIGQVIEFGFDGINGFTCGPEELPWKLCDECISTICGIANGELNSLIDFCNHCRDESLNREIKIKSLPKRIENRTEYALLKYG